MYWFCTEYIQRLPSRPHQAARLAYSCTIELNVRVPALEKQALGISLILPILKQAPYLAYSRTHTALKSSRATKYDLQSSAAA